MLYRAHLRLCIFERDIFLIFMTVRWISLFETETFDQLYYTRISSGKTNFEFRLLAKLFNLTAARVI